MLYEWLDVASLLARPRFAEHSPETIDALVDLSVEVATQYFGPAHRRADTVEPVVGEDGRVHLVPEVVEAVRRYREAGLQSATFDSDIGGGQLPHTVHIGASLFFQAAGVGVHAYSTLASGCASLIVAHGSADQTELYARPIIDGRWFGTMCLSEPHAGSSLGDIATKAVRQADGTYRLFGTKTWISAGDHELGDNIVHLVLARNPEGPAGVKGVSLFIVPKFLLERDGLVGERNDVALVGLNHKMGYRATTNAQLNFGEGSTTPRGERGAVGYLIGEENHGLAYMFHMMNEARINVGAGAVAIGYTGYLHSLAYARDRTQGRALSSRSPESSMIPLVDHPDVRRMLLAQKSYVEGGMALILWCAKLVDEHQTAAELDDRERAHALLEILTPIAKSWPSQWCLAANDLAIQVHGGAGYTKDYPVEMFYRDNRLNPIHEGTHGIQGLDLLGRKVLGDGGGAFQLLADAIRATAARADLIDGLSGYASQLEHGVDRLVEVTEHLLSNAELEVAMANSSIYLEATGHIVVAWMWLEQVVAAAGKEDTFYSGKRAACEYFYAFELPTVMPKLDLLASLNRMTLDLEPALL